MLAPCQTDGTYVGLVMRQTVHVERTSSAGLDGTVQESTPWVRPSSTTR
jgi:hypothetical protein